MTASAPSTVDESVKTPVVITKRIGPTTYKVSVHFSNSSKETIDDKLLRLIERDAATQ